MLRIGSEIGNYRIKRLVGRGGVGEVYLAEPINQSQGPQQVAIKVIKPAVASSLSHSTAWDEFLHVTRETINLRHPRISRFYGVGEQDIDGTKYRYVVMDYCEKGSLADTDWYRNRKKPSQETIAHFVEQAADALQLAHDKGITHEDIKPQNFLLCSDHPIFPDLRVTDFGTAKLINILDGANLNVRGTSDYIAPEQRQGQAVPASDQYSLAVVAYELLTGQLPFQNSQDQKKNPPLKPSTIDSTIPLRVDTVLLKALNKKPEDRYSSITYFASDLQQALSPDGTGHVPPVGLSQPLILAAPIPTPPQAPPPPPLSLPTKLQQPLFTWRRPGQPLPPPPNPLTRVLMVLAILLIVGSALFLAYSQNKAQNDARATVAAIVVKANVTTHAASTTVAQVYATATFIATNPHAPTLVLSDPLSNSHGWEQDQDSTGSCGFSGGIYHVIRLLPSGFHNCVDLQSSVSNNFIYEVRMQILKGNCGGMSFRRHGSEFYYFRACVDRTYDFIRYMSDASSTLNPTLKSGSSPAIQLGLNQVNLLAVVALGSMFDLYVNGQLITTAQDTSYTNGQIGLVAKADTNAPTEVVFSDLRVWQL